MLALRRLFRRQRGVSYSLSFVLIVPLYLTLMLLAVEAGLLLLTRLGLQYAAHMGARSAVVWQSAQPESLREERIKLAVVQALAGFLGGRQLELDGETIPPEADPHATDWADGVGKFQAPAVAVEPGLRRPYTRSRTPPDAAFLKRKFLSAWVRTTVELKPPTDDPHGPLTLTVRVRAPLYMPVVSRFLDPDLKAPFEYPMAATVTLPNDAPLSKDGTLGIKYQSFRK